MSFLSGFETGFGWPQVIGGRITETTTMRTGSFDFGRLGGRIIELQVINAGISRRNEYLEIYSARTRRRWASTPSARR